jgi:hypothetical protein
VKKFALLLAFLIAQPLLADSNLPPAYWAYRQLPDPKQEAKAQGLMAELRCLVCQGQSIADSDAELSPGYPGPPFFYGLALARSGDRAGAVAIWQQILTTAPRDAEWRPLVEQGVTALDAKPGADKPQAASGS